MATVEATQADRLFEVKSPLGKDVLLFHSMTANEQLSGPFEFDLKLLSKDHEIELDDVVGQLLTVRLDLPAERKTRFFNGYVSQFSYEGGTREFSHYNATLRPWFWLLTRKAGCRIFQEKTAPEIIDQVFQDNGFSDVEKRLSGEYKTWEYCVQYRESDFDFVSRMMEQEGIYYYFRHEDGKHTMVLSDSVSAHDPIPGYENVPYFPPTESGRRERDHLSAWSVGKQMQPGKYSLRDFDFEKPSADLETRLNKPCGHAHKDFEVYDYPGLYAETDEGETYARIRLEELHTEHEMVAGSGNVAGLFSGGLFNLTRFPRDDQNREYLVVSSVVELTSEAYLAGMGGGQSSCQCRIAALDSKVPYRAARRTPKPVVKGPQTAIVVGPSGEEIWTDKYSRVKVQFHWDREGKNDENSSCWIRVSSPWAGKSWGGVHIPRIGQEVIVDFLEGDPDRPIITGRVYNAESTVPYGLPDSAMISGIKSNSTPGGGGYNEFSMDDTKGTELVTVHAQYNMDTTVENDETLTVHNNRTSTIDVDDTESVGNNQAVTVGVNQDVTVGANHTETVGANQTVNVGSSKAETVSIAKALTIGAAYQVSVGGAMNETVGAAKAEEIGGAKIVAVGAYSSENVAGNKSTNVGGNASESVSGNRSVDAGGNISKSAGGTMSLNAKGDLSAKTDAKGSIDVADELVIKCGSAQIVLKKSGDILIKGAKISVKGSGDVVIKGSKILEN